jgi:hypothetical protein
LNGGSYRGLQPFNINEVTTKDYAVVEWKQLYKNATISGYNYARNLGEDQVVDLVEETTDELELNMIKLMETQLWGDGSGNGGLDWDGVQAAINLTSTYGGHAYTEFGTWDTGTRRAGLYIWAAQNLNAVAMTLDNWEKLYGQCSFGEDGTPTCFVTEQRPWDILWSAFTNAQRLVDPEIGKLGYRNIVINGVPNIVSNYCPTATGWFLNFNLGKLFIHPNRDFHMTPWKEPVNADGVVAQMLVMGNCIFGNRSAQGYFSGITGL